MAWSTEHASRSSSWTTAGLFQVHGAHRLKPIAYRPHPTRTQPAGTRSANGETIEWENGSGWFKASWFKMAPLLCGGNVPLPTLAYLESWRAPAHPEARPRQVRGLVWRQQARPARPQHDGSRAFNQVQGGLRR